MSATYIYYVNPGSTAGGTGQADAITGSDRAYASLSAAITAKAGSETYSDTAASAGDTIIFRCSGVPGIATVDTIAVTVSGFTAGVCKIFEGYNGKYSGRNLKPTYDNNGCYALEVSTVSVHAFLISTDLVELHYLQIASKNASNYFECVYIDNAFNGIVINGCRLQVKLDFSASLGCGLEFSANSDVAPIIINNIFEGNGNTNVSNSGIWNTALNRSVIINNTVYNFGTGLRLNNFDRGLVRNNLLINNNDDWYAASSEAGVYSNNADNDTDTFGINNITLNEPNVEVIDVANGDFRVKSRGGTNKIWNAALITGQAPTEDILGNKRVHGSIGAFEYQEPDVYYLPPQTPLVKLAQGKPVSPSGLPANPNFQTRDDVLTFLYMTDPIIDVARRKTIQINHHSNTVIGPNYLKPDGGTIYWTADWPKNMGVRTLVLCGNVDVNNTYRQTGAGPASIIFNTSLITVSIGGYTNSITPSRTLITGEQCLLIVRFPEGDVVNDNWFAYAFSAIGEYLGTSQSGSGGDGFTGQTDSAGIGRDAAGYSYHARLNYIYIVDHDVGVDGVYDLARDPLQVIQSTNPVAMPIIKEALPYYIDSRTQLGKLARGWPSDGRIQRAPSIPTRLGKKYDTKAFFDAVNKSWLHPSGRYLADLSGTVYEFSRDADGAFLGVKSANEAYETVYGNGNSVGQINPATTGATLIVAFKRLNATDQYPTLIGISDASVVLCGLQLSSGNIYTLVRNSADTGYIDTAITTSGTVGDVEIFALTYDGNNQRTYRNGTQVKHYTGAAKNSSAVSVYVQNSKNAVSNTRTYAAAVIAGALSAGQIKAITQELYGELLELANQAPIRMEYNAVDLTEWYIP